MAQTNYTPIILYNSGTTTNAPSAGNLASGELAVNYTDGKLFYKDNNSAIQVIAWKTTPTTAGGTGLTSYTAGDLPYYASGSTLSKLGIGTSGYVLESNGSAPTWVAQSTLSVGTATNATNTAITDNTSSSATWYPTIVSATTGNLPQTTSSTKLSFVPNTGVLTATGFSGSGSGLTNVSLTTGVTGTLPIANGGTGQTSFTSGQIHYGSFSTSSNLTFASNVLTVNGKIISGATSISATPGETLQIQGNTVGGQDYCVWTQGATSGVNAFAMRMWSTTASAVVGSIQFSGTTTTYNITSDRRLKTNIEPFTNSGAIIDALLPRTFNWIKDNSADIGFITDEYQSIFPTAVQGQPNEIDKDGNPVYQQGDFSTSAQIAVIVAELQSLRSRLKAANIA